MGDNDRLENIAALKEGVREAEDRSADVLTFEKYMTAVGTYIDEDKDNKEAPVKLMTVHAAKGLEMPYVFVVGMNERIFPSSNARTTDAMEEERRLAYVAFTRAEDTLYITESEKELKSDKSSFTYPSRFIFNTGFELLDQVCPLSEDLERRARLYIARSEKALQGKDEYEARKGTYEEGIRVKHAVHGYGVIQELRTDGSVLVDFDNRGTRTIKKVDVLTIVEEDEQESDDSEDHT